ncbi:MAG: hypothetical protein MUF19_02450 [Candidatus Pacebacteria bacterium]|jgi:hypothetical protein|nr:hypothetical protein [Candidatus Paceibacterota bacterium]
MVSVVFKILVVCVIGWVAFALFSNAQNKSKRQEIMNQTMLASSTYQYRVFEPLIIPLFNRTQYSATCEAGYRVEVTRNFTFSLDTTIMIDVLWPKPVERLAIYSPDQTQIYASPVAHNATPKESDFLYQQVFYDFESDSEQTGHSGFHVVIPPTAGVTPTGAASIAECLRKGNLVNVYTKNISNPDITESNGYYIDTTEGFASKQADRNKIEYGVASFTVLK